MPTREELKQEIEALEKELREREAALPIHSIRPGQIEAIEELEEQIREKWGLLKEVKAMGATVLSLSDKEALRLEEIITDRDREEALKFILEVLWPKLQAKGKGAMDQRKGMGIS